MADSRIRNLSGKHTPTSKADLTDVFLEVDKAGWTEVRRFDMLDMVVDTWVPDGDTTDYKFITPKALKATIATTNDAGIIKKATSLDIAGDTGTGAILSNQMVEVRANIFDYFCEKLGTPTFYLNTEWGMGFKASYYASGATGSIFLNPPLPAGKEIGGGTIAVSVASTLSNFSGHYSWVSASGSQSIQLSGGTSLNISSDRRNISIYNVSLPEYNRVIVDVQFFYQ